MISIHEIITIIYTIKYEIRVSIRVSVFFRLQIINLYFFPIATTNDI